MNETEISWIFQDHYAGIAIGDAPNKWRNSAISAAVVHDDDFANRSSLLTQ